MTITRPVVIGIDGSHDSALTFAVAEARRRGTNMRVIHCAAMPFEQMELYVSELTYREMMAEGQQVLDDTRKLVEQDAPDLLVDYELSSRAPVDVLMDESSRAGLLVLGIDDLPWFERLLGGAVAGHLARHSRCPVVGVPQPDRSGRRHEGVVVALDGDTAAQPLLQLAFEMAEDRGCTLHALRVVSTRAEPDAVASARANLAEVLAGWREAFPDARVVQEVVVGEPDHACSAATQDAEVVLVGRSAKHRLRRPVAVGVLRHARCPVGVVPLDGRDV
ncbi:MAG: universal stress protein [Aeromicrobium sp.]